MATVYLARDVRHERDVAIKVLNRDLADVIGADRFIAEIRTTAHLRHPHILPLFDSGAADGLPFYVMPFVDGESLRGRLRAQGRLPIPDALRTLREVADALAHAHALGIVHRDVKPDNVLMSGRHAFLADFGVSRAVAAHVGQDQTVTGTGVMVGTPAYMAPEQVTGGAIDHRSDVYAFGAMAYELLTGVTPFHGTRQDIVTALLTETPAPVVALRPETPAPLATAIMRCLQKKPDNRWQRIEDLLPVLDSTTTDGVGATLQGRARGPRIHRLVAFGMMMAAGFAAGYYALHRAREVPATLMVGKMIRVTSDAGLELDPAISPDGRAIAYAAGVPGHTRVYVRQISGGRMVPLTEDDSGGSQRWPQWSPDGTRIVFQAGRPHLSTRSLEGSSVLFEVPALGGVASRVPGEFPGGVAISPSWSRDGRRIAFAGVDGVYAIDLGSGKPPTLLAGGQEVTAPAWSPDGRRIAFVSRGIFFTFGEETFGNVSTSTIHVVDVESRKATQVTTGDWLDINPVWMPDSRTLLFISSRGGGRDVFRQRFDGTGDPLGEPERVTTGLNAHGISVSADGRLLAYSSYVQRASIWSIPIPTDRVASVREAEQVTFGTDKIEKLAISRDGRWMAYDSDRNGQPDIWKVPLAGGTPEQVTRGPNNKFVNDWSPDGQEIVYHSMREGGQRDVMIVSADGTKTEAVADSPAEEQHSGWGPDGNSIIYDLAASTDLQNQLYLVRRARRGAPWGTPKRLTSDGSSDPKWSPDGRLIAYCVRGELRVITPDGTRKRIVVPDVAGQPRPSYPIWSEDSRTIYYKAYDAQLQTSIWSVSADGGQPKLLVSFDDPTRRSLRREFATDGRRFYFTIANDESDLSAVELISK
jgi:serine/threonine-protein kinase